MWAKIVDFFVKRYGFKFLTDIFWDIVEYVKGKVEDKNRDKKQVEARKTLDEVLNNPESTKEDKLKAYEDYINISN